MRKNNFPNSIAALLLACGCVHAAEIQQPNVIIIFTDDQGYQNLSCFGSPDIVTPQIDRMAEEGVKFTDFHVSSSVCTASRASLLTGRKPLLHGMGGAIFPNNSGLPDNEITMADMLRDAGYATSLYGKWHLGDKTNDDLPMGRGFDEYFGIPYSNDMFVGPQQTFATNCVFLDGYTLELAELDKEAEYSEKKNKVPLFEGNEIVEYPADQATLTRRYFNRAISRIDEVTATDPNEPFFIYIAPAMPHVPLYASEDFAGISARGTYGDVIVEIDHHVGRLLDHLQATGLDERTLVIYTSDNGPWLGQGDGTGDSDPYRGGKFTVLEGGTRVPCVMWWPGTFGAGLVSDANLSTVDILPTVAHYTGATLPSAFLSGLDVSHHLENPALPTGRSTDAFSFNGTYRALRKGDWKIMPNGESSSSTSPKLYNIVENPAETLNLYDAEPNKVTELQADYDAFMATATAPVDITPPAVPVGGSASASAPGVLALDWSDNTDPDLARYIVYRSLFSGGGYTPIAVCETSEHSDSSLISGGTNYYVVVAVDERGNQSAYSAEFSAIPLNTPPSEQLLLEFDFSGLSGNNPSIVPATISSNAYVSVDGGLARNDLELSTSNLADDEWNLATGIENATLDDVLESTNNLHLNFNMSAFTGFQVVVTGLEYDFYRDGAESPSDYHVLTDVGGSAGYNVIAAMQATNSAQTTFEVTNLWINIDPSVEFRMYMSGNQAADASTHLNGVKVYGFTIDVPPAAPAGLTATTPIVGTVNLDWTANSDVDLAGYTVYRSVDGGNSYAVVATNVTETTYVDTGLAEGETVFYSITANDAGQNESAFSATVSIKVKAALTANGTIDLVNGEFADYNSLTTGDEWEDSVDDNGALSLTVSRTAVNGEWSSSKWNANNYSGANTEINFTKGSGSASNPTEALGDKTFIAIQLDASGEPPKTFTIGAVSASMWRNGGQAADVYQFAYDVDGDGYDADDFIGTAVTNTVSGLDNAFTLSANVTTDLSIGHEVRLYFWKQAGDGVSIANTHLVEVTAEYSIADKNTIDIIGSVSSGGGGEFADYSDISGIDNPSWMDSWVDDGFLSLRASQLGFNGDISASGFNADSYRGAGTEINFTAGVANLNAASAAISANTFIAFKFDSTGFSSDLFELNSISLSLYRNGGAAAQGYQLAYDQDADGYDSGDLIGEPTTVSDTSIFTLSESLSTDASEIHEVRLYFWGGSMTSGNTHLLEVSAEYIKKGSQASFSVWVEQFGGTNALGSASDDFDGDSLSNFGEYALNGNPTNGADRGPFHCRINGSTFLYEYDMLAYDTNPVYTLLDDVELSFTNSPGTNAYASRTVGPTVGNYQRVTNTYTMTTDQLFIKLEIEQQ